QALVFGIVLSVFGVGYLAIVCNVLSAALTAITVAIYIFAYTPLKRASTANTAVGAVPGAIPPMIGWAAARGNIGAGAWALFAIFFCGNCRISSPSRGCTGKTIRGRAFA